MVIGAACQETRELTSIDGGKVHGGCLTWYRNVRHGTAAVVHGEVFDAGGILLCLELSPLPYATRLQCLSSSAETAATPGPVVLGLPKSQHTVVGSAFVNGAERKGRTNHANTRDSTAPY